MQSSQNNLKINISPLNIETISDDNQKNPGNPPSPFTESMTELEKAIKDLQDSHNKQANKIAILEKSNQKYIKFYEDEKSMINKLKNLLNDEEKTHTKQDQHIKSLLVEIESLKKAQVSSPDKVLAEAKVDIIKEKSRADALARDYKDLTQAYENSMKDLADKRREMQNLQQENDQLKKLLYDLKKSRQEKSPVTTTTASAFFTEKKSYNRDGKRSPNADILNLNRFNNS